MKRIWKVIEETKGWYMISNDGLVKSIDRHVMIRGLSPRKGTTLKQKVTNCGYCQVRITFISGARWVNVHRLVAKHFISNHNNKPFVNHKDCNKRNNKVSNLEWVTAKENMHHAYKNNLIKICRGSELSKRLTESKVITIRKLRNRGWTFTELGNRYNVDRMTIFYITHRKTWKHI